MEKIKKKLNNTNPEGGKKYVEMLDRSAFTVKRNHLFLVKKVPQHLNEAN